jgi:hypothetical protein
MHSVIVVVTSEFRIEFEDEYPHLQVPKLLTPLRETFDGFTKLLCGCRPFHIRFTLLLGLLPAELETQELEGSIGLIAIFAELD